MRGIAAVGLGLVLAQAASAQEAQRWQPYSAGLQSQAIAGDPAAQFAMGEAYRTGNGIVADREQAIAWYRKAAPRDTRAADALAVLLFTKGERKQSIPLLQAAAGRRSDYALYILGTARFNGDYVPRDLARAYADMRLAAATLPQAVRSLGLMEPYVTPGDRERADLLAAQPGGPEAGAPAAPSYAAVPVTPPPVPIPPVRQPLPSRPTLATAPETPDARTSTARTIKAPPVRPATVSPATGSWKVQLGAYGSEERARTQWTSLAAKVPALAALRRTTEPAGALVRLQASGIASREAAAALCRDVAAAGAGCFVVQP